MPPEHSTAFYSFMGTALTGVLALLVLMINQFFEFKKAALARQFVELDARKKDETLTGIHTLVNSQLNAAMERIKMLTNEVSELEDTVRGLINTPKAEDLLAKAMIKVPAKHAADEPIVTTAMPVVLKGTMKIGQDVKPKQE